MDNNSRIKIALPKGRLLAETASLLQVAEWGLCGYHEKTRLYHLDSTRFPYLSAKVFNERDIPVQVAVGNYDLGICGLDWIEELLVKYPGSALIKVKDLGYEDGALHMATSVSQAVLDRMAGSSNMETILEILRTKPDTIRIASEYPNLSASFALKSRLRRFSIFPLWGAAEVYPPESADLVLVPAETEAELSGHGLIPLAEVLKFSVYLIANRNSWETKDMGEVLASVGNGLVIGQKQSVSAALVNIMGKGGQHSAYEADKDSVWLALPDGHQQAPAIELLKRAGIKIDDYPSSSGNRRPAIGLPGVMVKVIRPQDMPLQVANGNFDLAITGRDWLTEHLCQFPSSPVSELLDLKFGRVRIVAVVGNDMGIDDVNGLRQISAGRLPSMRVASEYINIADRFARDNRLGMYRVIPTWGASEGFIPEDADLLVENTETGGTLAKHNLKIIETLFTSTARLIGNNDSISSAAKSERIRSIIEILQNAVEGA